MPKPDPLDKPVPVVKQPSTIAVYAKAVVALIVAEAVAVGAWSAVLPDGPISRNGWIGLAVASAGPLGVAFGVGITTNAQPVDAEAGTTTVGVVLFVLLVIVALSLGFGLSHFWLLLLILALALLLL